MANLARWNATSGQGTVLTTEANALVIGGYTVAGTAFDNTTAANLNQWAKLDIALPSIIVPAGTPSLTLFFMYSMDGTTYEDVVSANQVGFHNDPIVCSVTVGTSAKRISSPSFRIWPFKFKVVMLNNTGVQLAATLNTVTLYTWIENLNG